MAYVCIYRRIDDVKGRAEALNLPANVPLVQAPKDVPKPSPSPPPSTA
jgi:hypothetical protein